jgi:serine phosphatase RsbU (regulator of sigma subunit)
VTNLFTAVLLNIAVAVILYISDKKTAFNKLSYQTKQIIYGVVFGLLAVFSSTNYGGINVGGAIVNVRDASPLCAGLIFGAPAGVISGIIGGIFRYIAPFWNISGSYTQLACSVSTALAGFIAALLRRFMFDNKKASWIYGIGIAMVTEILHMLMIFFTNMNDVSTAFEFVKKCTLPMVIGNSLTVGIAIAIVSLIGRKKNKRQKSQKQISQTFQTWLLICIIIAFVITGIFTSVLQTRMSETQVKEVIGINLGDVYQDITDASDENLLDKTSKICEEYLNGEELAVLAEKYNVIEVNVIDTNGIIVNTNNEEFIGYEMDSGEQSAEFLVLLDGDKEYYVQDYRPTSYDNKTFRKYGAITLPDGGFLQVGYDATQFGNDIDTFVGRVAKNRHIGNIGFVIICNESFNIVTEGSEHFGENISALGFEIDFNSIIPGEIFETSVNGIPYLCAYHFVEGYYIVGTIPLSEAMYMMDVSVYVNIFMEMVIFAALFVLIYFLIKRIVIDNIKRINSSLSEITGGNLDVTVDVRSNMEFASLSDDINSTVSTLKHYIAEAAARIDKELEFAKQIQISSLPMKYPDCEEFDLYAEMQTAKEVGGDFYDFYTIDETKVAFLVADVSGKGIPAAMFMMKAKAIIKDLTETGMELSEVFTKANEKLCENNEAGMFVTAWMGILDLMTGTLSFANAGHNPPLIKTADGKFEYLKARSGLFLAGMEDIKYKKNQITLNPGEMIYLYTDGVTEATNISNELYGDKRLHSVLNENSTKTPYEILEAVKKDIDVFAGEAEQFDDITMLCLEYKKKMDTEV